jgi:PAS domain S-box-containing protein
MIIIILLLKIIFIPVYADSEIKQKKILILHSDNPFIPSNMVLDRTFFDVLTKTKTFSASFYSEFLDLVRFNSKSLHDENIEYLTVKYSGMKLDLIIVTDDMAWEFLAAHGKNIFHNTPVVFCSISKGYIDGKKIPVNATGIFKVFDVRANIENILKIHHNVQEIAVIVGNDNQDKVYENIAIEAMNEYKGRVKFRILKNYSLEEIIQITSNMQPDTVALYLPVHKDGAGKTYVPREALSQISRNAGVPIYSQSDVLLGYGIVGGNLFSFQDVSRQAALIAIDVLNGKSPSEIPALPMKNKNYFDWKELRKWHISLNSLPEGSIIVNRPPNPWDLFRTQIILITAFFIMALFLISSLIIQLRLKQKADESLRRLNRVLGTISECNQVIVRAIDEQALLNDICRIICEMGGFRMVWVGYPENDEGKTVKPVSWNGFESGFLSGPGITWADTERGRGPAGTAIRTGKISCVQDYRTDQSVEPWREEAEQRSYRSSIGLPLLDGKRNVFGVLSIYAEEPGAFENDEIRLLEELAGDIAFGIITMRALRDRGIAEEALAQSEEKFSKTFQDAPIMYSLTELETGKFIEVNEAAILSLGYSREEVVGHTAVELGVMTSDDRGRMIEELRSRGKVSGIEMALKSKSGKKIIGLMGGERVLISGKDCILMTMADITERKQAEEELSYSRESYRRLFENHSAVKLIIDPDTGLILDANYAAADYYGWPREELKRMKIDQINTLSTYEVKNEMEKARVSKRTQFEFRHIRADGSVRDVEVFSSLIEMMGKDVLHSIIHDITDRKIAEKELIESEEHFRTVIENASVGVCLVGLDNKFISVNQTMTELLGYSEEELRRLTFNDVTHSEDREIGSSMVSRVLSGEMDRFSIEKRYIHKDRHTVWGLVSSSLIRDSKNKPEYFVTHVQDITERKQIENQFANALGYIQTIFENSPIGISTYKADGQIVSTNPALAKIVGEIGRAHV